MSNCITWVGIDDSVKKLNIAVFYGEEENPRFESVFSNDSTGLGRLAKKLKTFPGEVRCVYEAGINGYHLYRFLKKHEIFCDIAAPSLTPRQAGKRVKTDRLDAKKLARFYRTGMLTSIVIPETEQESPRDMMRAHDNLRKTRGQDGSLLLSCKTLSFSASCRFIPALWVSTFPPLDNYKRFVYY